MHASMNVAENVPRLSLLVIEASVSLKPCFLSRLASSTYVTSPSRSFRFRNAAARAGVGLEFVGHISAPGV